MQAKGFLKKLSAKKFTELINLSRSQLRILKELLTGNCHLKGHPLKLRLVNSPKCDKCKQASDTASQILCDCEALAARRFRQLRSPFYETR
jgi:hypothetical protein